MSADMTEFTPVTLIGALHTGQASEQKSEMRGKSREKKCKIIRNVYKIGSTEQTLFLLTGAGLWDRKEMFQVSVIPKA